VHNPCACTGVGETRGKHVSCHAAPGRNPSLATRLLRPCLVLRLFFLAGEEGCLACRGRHVPRARAGLDCGNGGGPLRPSGVRPCAVTRGNAVGRPTLCARQEPVRVPAARGVSAGPECSEVSDRRSLLGTEIGLRVAGPSEPATIRSQCARREICALAPLAGRRACVATACSPVPKVPAERASVGRRIASPPERLGIEPATAKGDAPGQRPTGPRDRNRRRPPST